MPFITVLLIGCSYPPDKRPNYLKLGTATPFEPLWPVLVHDWSKKLVLTKDSKPDPDAARKCQFFVLRDSSRLNIWSRCLERKAISKSKKSDLDLSEQDEKGLLPVQVCGFHFEPNTKLVWNSTFVRNLDFQDFK